MRAGDGGLEVFGEAAIAPKPREGALDDPAARKQNKAFGLMGALDNLGCPIGSGFCQSVGELVAAVAAIGKEMPQPWIFILQGFGNQRPSVAILNISRMHHSLDQPSACIGDDMPLAALDAFACIVATRPTTLGGLDTLAVNHARCRTGLSTLGQSVGSNQRKVDF